MRIALFYCVLGQTTSGVSINRDTSSTRGRAGGSPLTPLQNNLIFPGQAVDSAHFLLFKHLRGVDQGNPPSILLKRASSEGALPFFVLHSKRTKDSFLKSLADRIRLWRKVSESSHSQ